jgi:2-polyprenyl-6-methoxyphenol hydroxylase-like FAD-dependent oxidoreductase
MTTSRPIEIIGGGLAGLSLGLALRRADIDVTLYEAGTYPRHRVCGEFITGLSAATRARLGLNPFLADAALNREVAWFFRETPVRIQRLPSIAPSISRHALDARLAQAFVDEGGSLHTGTRMQAGTDAPGRVFATGRRRSRSGLLGLKIHALNLRLARDLELHLGNDAYVGLSRIEAGRVNICGLFKRRELCAKGPDLLVGYLQAAGLNSLAVRIDRSETDASSFCAVAAVDFDQRFPASTDVRLGDAGAMIPPFTGHGMAMAFQSAESALDPLTRYARGEEEWPSTRADIQRALRRRFRFRLASAGMLHSFLLQPNRQRWLAALTRARLVPMRPLYAALH